MVVSSSLLRKIELQEDFLEFLKNELHNHFWIRFSSELTLRMCFEMLCLMAVGSQLSLIFEKFWKVGSIVSLYSELRSELTFENVSQDVVPHGGRRSIDCC